MNFNITVEWNPHFKKSFKRPSVSAYLAGVTRCLLINDKIVSMLPFYDPEIQHPDV